MKRSYILLVALGAFLFVGWAVFRPELLFINQHVNESFPESKNGMRATANRVLASGEFKSVAHETKGLAAVHQLQDGGRVLRLTNFETSNGPDVRVLLVAAKDAMDSESVSQAGYVELGKLKGNIGDQNYDVPAGLDLSKYRAVTIWCNRFNVNFGTAPLN
ncbi:MAG TPA: DM13 domain-containing protein [Pirellulaceae bacterium]|nr:DM13 domain-containing protein [Pirellulaceae bacterium]